MDIRGWVRRFGFQWSSHELEGSVRNNLYLAGSIAALGTLIAALFALGVYKRNSRLERARWASSLYEKFFEKDDLKLMRDALDCSVDSDEVNQTVIGEDPRFTDYLNFFESSRSLKTQNSSKSLKLRACLGII